MVSQLSSFELVHSCTIKSPFVPLVAVSDSSVLVYDEQPLPSVRLFDSNCSPVMNWALPSYLVDMCYSPDLSSFVLLSPTRLYTLNPSVGQIQRLLDYSLLKENRSMSSLCSTGDHRLLILYRFGEYLDQHPKGKRIWKRRHLCESLCEDIALIRSSKGDSSFLVGLLIVEWNGIWRVDVFSSSLHRLHAGFRFNGWTRRTWLSEWSPHQCWFVAGDPSVMIDAKGQPARTVVRPLDSNTANVAWLTDRNNRRTVTVLVQRDEAVSFCRTNHSSFSILFLRT